MRSRHLPARLTLPALLIILGAAVFGSTLAIAQRGRDYDFFDPIIDIKSFISARYVQAPDDDALQLGAIRGMLEALDDPYTFYVPAAETREFRKEVLGEYVGIGVYVVQRDGWLTVVSPLDGSPAIAAGVMADDRIVEINGAPTRGRSPDECVELLVGKPGEDVTLTIERRGQRLPITITRQLIQTQTVKGWRRTGAGRDWDFILDPEASIACIRITQFNATTIDELNEALAAAGAEAPGFGGLILDVRSNPGGLLDQAEAVADRFLDSGVIYAVEGRAHDRRIVRARSGGTLGDFPLLVLIDGGSASGSELLAGALVENDRAIALGSRTFGKGSVQGVFEVPGQQGAQLKLTEAVYLLPSGRSIHRWPDSTVWGVDPTDGFYLPVSDEQRIEIFRMRQEDEVIRAEGELPREEALARALGDPQLAAALDAMRNRIATGAWQPVTEGGETATDALAEELRRAEARRDTLVAELTRVSEEIDRLARLAQQADQAGAEPPAEPEPAGAGAP
ncbi:MAG: S41 family peptidase [Phycisphaerales bacterium JB039]